MALHASPTGTSCAPSSPATARCRRSGSSSAAQTAGTRRAGSATTDPRRSAGGGRRDGERPGASRPGRSSARRRKATRCGTAATCSRPTPSWPCTTRASCSGAARRASGCGSCAGRTSDLDDPDLLQPPLDRSFKKPGGYVMRDKLAAAREQRRDQAKPKARTPDDVGGRRRPRAGDRDASSLLLLTMADDEFVIGFSDSEWTGIAPMLEEDVAISSIAQDELGHAQALYQLLADVLDDGRDADAHRLRPPAGGLPPRPAARPSARRLGRHDRPPLPVRHRRRGPAGCARRVGLRAARRAGRQDPPRGALPPDARRHVAGAAGRGAAGSRASGCSRRSTRSGRTPRRCFTPLADEPAW